MDKQRLIAMMAASIFAARTNGQEDAKAVTLAAERAIADARSILEQVFRTVPAGR